MIWLWQGNKTLQQEFTAILQKEVRIIKCRRLHRLC